MTTLNKIFLFIIAVLTGLLFITYNSCNNEKAAFSGLTSIIDTQSDTIITYKNKSGKLETEKEAALTDKAGLQAFLDSKTKEAEDLKQQLADAQIKLKNLSSVSTVVTNTGITKKNPPIEVTVHDTTILKQPALAFDTITRYYKIGGVINDKKLEFSQLSFEDSLSIVVGFKQKNFLSRKIFTINAETSNPYSHVTGLNNISISKDKSIFGSPILLLGVGAFVGFITFHFVK